MKFILTFSLVRRNGKIVWKHGPDWPFYELMLRTNLYKNPLFFTVDQNVNQPKRRPARTAKGPMFLHFYVIIVSVFSFFCQNTNCAVTGCNLSNQHCIKHRVESQTTQIIRFFFILCQELPIKQLGERHPSTIELASRLVYVLYGFKTSITSRNFSLP